jgi:hypothetical protein
VADVSRDFKTEYRRRIARGLARGHSRSQARGHAPRIERSIRAGERDEKIEAAVRLMNRGRPLSSAARASRVSAERLRRFLEETGIGRRQGRRWMMFDDRTRRVAVLTKGRQQIAYVRGFDQASLVAQHDRAARQFVKTNDESLIEPFEGRSVRTTAGKRIRLETDPNGLHRIASLDNPEFHETYEIVS